jgi:hypothetical protein
MNGKVLRRHKNVRARINGSLSLAVCSIFQHVSCKWRSYLMVLKETRISNIIEDFTLPHRFQVEFLLQAAQPNISQIPPGIHGIQVESMDSTPFHLLDIGNFTF